MSDFTDLVASDLAAGGVFADLEQTITQWIRGDQNNTATITAVVDWGDKPRRRDTASIQDRYGEDAKQQVVLRNIQPDTTELHPKDRFELSDGSVINGVQVVDRDLMTGYQAMICIAPRLISTRQSRPNS
jgi:hypothetical protein